MNNSIYWVRTDLRTSDNPSLVSFCRESEAGLLVWCPTTSYLSAGIHRKKFIDECVSEFAQSVQLYGQSLSIYELSALEVLPDLIHDYKINKLFFNREHAINETNDEQKIIELCKALNVGVIISDSSALVHSDDLPFKPEAMPNIFTEFRKKIEYMLKIRPLLEIPKQWPLQLIIKKLHVNFEKNLKPNLIVEQFVGGETAALAQLKHYIWDSKAIQTYKLTRNGMLDWDDSSKFSPWLSQGCISPRTIYFEIKEFERLYQANESTYWLFFELLWRDYFKYFSRKIKNNLFKYTGPEQKSRFHIAENKILFNEWCKGETASLFVNANMNELNLTGWMSNRGRQNIASYLIHNLKLPWTWGAAYFEKMLVDYDPDSNWGNWLYISGQGASSAPRMFNIEKQAKDYDPNSTYQKKWIDLKK